MIVPIDATAAEAVPAMAPKMAEDALASGSPGNNPRRPTREEIVEIYGKLFET